MNVRRCSLTGLIFMGVVVGNRDNHGMGNSVRVCLRLRGPRVRGHISAVPGRLFEGSYKQICQKHQVKLMLSRG